MVPHFEFWPDQPPNRVPHSCCNLFSLRGKKLVIELGLQKNDLDGKESVQGKSRYKSISREERHLKPRSQQRWLARGTSRSSERPECHLHEEWEKSLERKVRTLRPHGTARH